MRKESQIKRILLPAAIPRVDAELVQAIQNQVEAATIEHQQVPRCRLIRARWSSAEAKPVPQAAATVSCLAFTGLFGTHTCALGCVAKKGSMGPNGVQWGPTKIRRFLGFS